MRKFIYDEAQMWKTTNHESYLKRFCFGLIMLLSVTAFGATSKIKKVAQSSHTAARGGAPTATRAAQTTSSQAESIWIMRSDGALSCEPDSGISLEKGAEDLKKTKIPVLDSKKSSDGKMHALSCGMPAGSTNAYLIPKDRLQEALKLGFVQMIHL